MACGTGKTTTIRMACGLIVPTVGTIRLNGCDVSKRRGGGAADRRGAVGVTQRVLAADRLAEPDVLRVTEGPVHRRDQAAGRATAHRPRRMGSAERDRRLLCPRHAAQGRDRRRGRGRRLLQPGAQLGRVRGTEVDPLRPAASLDGEAAGIPWRDARSFRPRPVSCAASSSSIGPGGRWERGPSPG